MKRIVRLTESDLARIVRRVINESNEMATSILSQMESLCNNGKAESEAMKQVVYKIKDKATYDAIHTQVQSSPEFKASQGYNYGTIADWLTNEGVSKVATTSARENMTGFLPGISNAVRGVSIGREIARHLGQFNEQESLDLSYGTTTF